MAQRKNYKKWIWLGMGAVLIIVIVVGIIIGVNNQSGKQDNENKSEETEKVEKKDEIEQNEKTEEEKKDEETARQQTPTQYEGSDPNTAEELSGIITYAGVNEATLVVRTSIDQYLTEGVCELTLMRGGAIIYSESASIVGDVSTATCQGFDIVTAGLGGGNTEIIINLSADGRRGTIRGEANI